MKNPKRPPYNPLTDLIRNMRVAAAQIEEPQARRIAASAADRIPLTRIEKAHGAKAKMARLGRLQMRALPDLPREKYADAQSVLRAVVDALDSRFEVTSETHLGQRARKEGRGHARHV